eukprot:753319-Hanusia_phi.AAC.9
MSSKDAQIRRSSQYLAIRNVVCGGDEAGKLSSSSSSGHVRQELLFNSRLLQNLRDALETYKRLKQDPPDANDGRSQGSEAAAPASHQVLPHLVAN